MAEGLDKGRYRTTITSQPNNTPNTPGIASSSGSWTPFSGMPADPVSQSGIFTWDTINTSTPFQNEQMPTYYPPFPDYVNSNILHGASGNSGYDMSAAPVNMSIPIQRQFFDPSSPESLEIYAQAIKQYQEENAAAARYTHFAPETAPSSPDVFQPNTEQINVDPVITDTKKDLGLKPSYSDIAKTLKTKTVLKGKDDREANKSKSPEIIHRVLKSQTKRSSSNRNSTSHAHTGEDRNIGRSNAVSPNSKYGLDQFEEVDTESKSDRSSGLGGSNENLSYRSRRGSTSSLSSGTSGGIDDYQSAKPVYQNQSFSTKDTENSKDLPKGNLKKENISRTGEPISPNSKERSNKFFDPRRIFQSKETNKKRNESREKAKSADSGTVLNNGKPSSSHKPPSAAHRKADYINNDLRDSRKRTNHNSACTSNSEVKKSTGSSENLAQNGMSEKNKSHNLNQRKEVSNGRTLRKSNSNLDWEAIDECVNNVAEKIKNWVKFIVSFLLKIFIYVCGIFMYMVSCCVHIIGVVGVKVWNWCSSKFFSNKFAYNQKNSDNVKRKIGLEENIVLPTTGEEAMKRLLSCKGKDPYSILGLRADASDEDVKRYYRKQAVLVHPDKNQDLGAEESFKILGHAFEMIGDPSKRAQFDAKTKEESDTESAMREFADLLTKLQEKIQEAANLMRCDNCNDKHKRIPVDRAWYSARYCEKCNIRHPAKEGDVWAETSMLGFLWHYYAIMDGNVYDITEWVACHKDFFKHMQANAHPVLYRIATDGNKNHRSQGQSREAELEDFINQFFNKANLGSGEQGHSGTGSAWQRKKSQQASSSQWNSSSGGGKKSRKKKKRH